MHRSPTLQRAAALLAVVFGLAWGAPVAEATCMSAGSSMPDHCGSSAPAEHCEGTQGAVSSVCITHHASQDLRTAKDVEPVAGDVAAERGRTQRPTEATITSIAGPRRAVDRAVRRHAHVGVWLE